MLNKPMPNIYIHTYICLHMNVVFFNTRFTTAYIHLYIYTHTFIYIHYVFMLDIPMIKIIYIYTHK